jgi:hypothetical protein
LLFGQHELRPYRLPGPFVSEGNVTPDFYLHFLQDEIALLPETPLFRSY